MEIIVQVDTSLAEKWLGFWTWFFSWLFYYRVPFAFPLAKKLFPLIARVTKRLIRVNVR